MNTTTSKRNRGRRRNRTHSNPTAAAVLRLYEHIAAGSTEQQPPTVECQSARRSCVVVAAVVYTTSDDDDMMPPHPALAVFFCLHFSARETATTCRCAYQREAFMKRETKSFGCAAASRSSCITCHHLKFSRRNQFFIVNMLKARPPLTLLQ